MLHHHWKRIISLCLSVCIAMSLIGCAGAPSADSSQSLPQGGAKPDRSEIAAAAGGLFLPSPDQAFSDNAMDAYTAVINTSLEDAVPEDVATFLTIPFLNGNGAFLFRQLYQEDAEASFHIWSELLSVSENREKNTAKSDGSQICAAGGIYGDDKLLMIRQGSGADPSQIRLFFVQINEKMEELDSIFVDFSQEITALKIFGVQQDKSGRIHLLVDEYLEDTTSKYCYLIFEKNGTLLYDQVLDSNYARLVSLFDGRTALYCNALLTCADPDTGSVTEIPNGSKDFYLTYTLSDENTLLTANSMGLYESDLSSGDSSLLYQWSNHGLVVANVTDICKTDTGRINLIYSDEKGSHYLSLTPTAVRKEPTEITLAVMASRGENLKGAVAEFNRSYPEYHLSIKQYPYNDPAFMTSLIAGEGAVLIDTSLIGFEDHAEYWEPLDEVFRQMDIADELVPKAMELGKINDTRYGIVESFVLNTVVTASVEKESWDYEEFLQAIDENPDLESLFYSSSGNPGPVFVSYFFLQSMEDNYLFDAKNCTTHFDSDEFRKILHYGMQFQDKQISVEQLLDGRSLCNVVRIERPQQLALIRLLLKEDAHFIGFPSSEGSKCYIQSASDPLAVRASATEEEKRAAHTFLKLLLTYDCQKSALKAPNFGMSVRKDVLESQLDFYAYDTAGIIGFPQVFFSEEDIDRDADQKMLYDLLDSAEPQQNVPIELILILYTELFDYFDSNITEDMVIRNLDNRIGLYLKERSE